MRSLVLVLFFAFFLPQACPAAPLSTAFTYQGQLRFNGVLQDGTFDFQFCLYANASGGSALGCAPIQEDVTVTEGRFTVQLDFGNVFDGEQKFAEIGVRSGASTGTFSVLAPRQELTATPYALRAIATARPTLRGYYQTSATVTGSGALTACASGYHMASMAEIFQTASLRYAKEVPGAATGQDSGDGPPFSLVGWIRTGVSSNTSTQVGAGNCALWTSSNSANNGTTVGLQPNWLLSPTNLSPWDGLSTACNVSRRVWCVEDLP
jgi:hypothetical protein